jgi:putative spermidine/putrescine transport system permease protein/mannopine transport system permease protein
VRDEQEVERMTATTTATTSLPAAPAPGGSAPGERSRWRWRRPGFVGVVLGVPVIFMTVMYAYPVGKVLSRSVTDPEVGFGNFVAAWQDPVLLKVLWITVRLALQVSVITVVLGFPIAYFMSVIPRRRARIIALFVIIPFWTSVLVRSFAWIVLLGDEGIVSDLLSPFTGDSAGLLYTEPAVIIAMTHVLLPFTILIIKGTLDQIDGSLMRAARTLGAGPVRAFLRVYLPLAVPAMISSGMLVFIMALGYYITPALVGGPAQTTIAMLIEQKVNVTFQWGLAATLSTILLVVSVLLFALVRKVTKVKGVVAL